MSENVEGENDLLMTVQDMIYEAFDGRTNNRVHFKLLQTIIFILAQQLRILDRQVEVSETRYEGAPTRRRSTIQIEEIKLLSISERKERGSSDREGGLTVLGQRSSVTSTPGTGVSDTASAVSTSRGAPSRARGTAGTSRGGTATSAGEASGEGQGRRGRGGGRGAAARGARAARGRGRGGGGGGGGGRGASGVDESDETSRITDSTTTATGTMTDRRPSKQFAAVGEPESSTSSDKVTSKQPERTPSDPYRLMEQSTKSGAPDSSTVGQDSTKQLVRKDKLLVVGPQRQRRASQGAVSIVTREEFEDLKSKIIELEDKFYPKGKDREPKLELMMELRRPSSLSDAIAGLHMAAKLDIIEKTMEQMNEVIAGLARRSGLSISKDGKPGKELETLYENYTTAAAADKPTVSKSPRSSTFFASKYGRRKTLTDTGRDDEGVTFIDLTNALRSFAEDITKATEAIVTKNKLQTQNALKLSGQLELKLKTYLNVVKKMEDVEALVNDYADKVTILDTNLSSQMTNYQEQLSQMQHDLEAGIENMAEAVASIGGDTTAIAELNSHFNAVQVELDQMAGCQKDFQEAQNLLVCDTQDLWRQVEFLKAAKSDREEVEDALRDKAGIEMLNALVTREQFFAVRTDLDRRITAAYNIFNSQEYVWQKMIDDLLKAINEKADIDQLNSLQDSVNAHCTNIQDRLEFMLEIVGDPPAAALQRRIHRDAVCISCSSPAHMSLEEPSGVMLPPFKPKKKPVPEEKPKADGDHALLCYVGRKITHPLDRRAKICSRYCGGSHTVVPGQLTRAPLGISINPLPQEADTAVGTDGKVYKTDEKGGRPCIPCNAPGLRTSIAHTAAEPMEGAKVPDMSGSVTPRDYHKTSIATDVTPPMMMD